MRKLTAIIQIIAFLVIVGTAGRIDADPTASLAKGSVVVIGAMAVFAVAQAVKEGGFFEA